MERVAAEALARTCDTWEAGGSFTVRFQFEVRVGVVVGERVGVVTAESCNTQYNPPGGAIYDRSDWSSSDATGYCSACGARLMFSARQAGRGLCGPCARRADGTETEADIERRGRPAAAPRNA